MHEQGKSGASRKMKRRMFAGILVCLVVAVAILLDLYEYRTKTYVDLYTGIIRSEAMLGIIPLPDRYSMPDHAEWALQNMQIPAKRKWAICSDCSRNWLTGRGICADAEPLDAMYTIHAPTLDSAEKLRYLNEWQRDVDTLSEKPELSQELFKSWWKKLEAFPGKR